MFLLWTLLLDKVFRLLANVADVFWWIFNEPVFVFFISRYLAVHSREMVASCSLQDCHPGWQLGIWNSNFSLHPCTSPVFLYNFDHYPVYVCVNFGLFSPLCFNRPAKLTTLEVVLARGLNVFAKLTPKSFIFVFSNKSSVIKTCICVSVSGILVHEWMLIHSWNKSKSALIWI